MIKLQDFAKESGLTDRQIQRQLKKYEKDLQGHFERRGQNGTWLDEEACDFLRSHMRTAPVALVEEDARIAELEQKLRERDAAIERKDMLIDRLQVRVEERDQRLIENEKQFKAIESRKKEEIQQVKEEYLEKGRKEGLEEGRETAKKEFRDLGAFGRFFWKG